MSHPSPAKFKLEPTIYDITPVNSMLALDAIHQYSLSTIDPSYMNQLTNNLIYRHNCQRATMFGFIYGPANADIAQRVIGADGYFLKLTNTLTGVDYIWFDQTSNTFLVWGSNKFKVVKALNALRWRIHKYSSIILDNNLSETDYSDMPELIDCDECEAANASEAAKASVTSDTVCTVAL
jgi:hypothetical protein